MELRILGPIEVRHDGSPLLLRGAKPRQLLALLAIRANRSVTAEELIEELWEGEPPPSAATALRVHIGRLRQVLELDRNPKAPSARLPAGPHGYSLRVEPDELDSQRFERLVLLARDASARGDPACAVPQLTEALDLWRGCPLSDVRDLSAARSEIARLNDLRAIAIEELAEARLVLGDHLLVIDVLTAALEEFPLRERLTASLMLALYRSGRQADALRAYGELARRLDEQLGVPPSAELRQLEADVLLQQASLNYVPARATAQPSSQTRSAAVRFVGRRRELEDLARLFDSVDTGECRLAVVSGAAGIGKTSLIEQFCAQVRARGGVPLVGYCEAGKAGDYQPVVEILRTLLSGLDPRGCEMLPPELSLLLPELRPATGGQGAGFDAEAEAARYRLFEAIAHTLARLCGRPSTLVIEDLHWADRPTLRLLRHLLRHPKLDRVLVVATFRDDEISGERADLVAGLAPPSRVRTLELGGFTDHEVRALVRATAPPETMHTLIDLTVTLQDITGGNPFFLRELLRELDEEPIKLDSGPHTAHTLATIAPAGVRALVERRLERLTGPARGVMHAAAAVGRDISASLLAAICEMSTDDTLDALEQGLSVRLVIEDDQQVDRYLFPHALVRNAVYATIPSSQRRRLHQRAAIVLAAADRDLSNRSSAELAHHFFEAEPLGLGREAAAYAELAGQEADARFAFAEAARWYEQALQLRVDMDRSYPDIGRMQLALGRAYVNDKQLELGRSAFLAAAARARETADAALLADVALAADGPWSSGSAYRPDALGLLEEALEGIDPSDSQRRVQILNGIAADLYYHDPDREGRVAHEALTIAQESADNAALATAHLAVHRWYTHMPDARRRRLELAANARALVGEASTGGELALRVHRELLADLLENAAVAEFDADLDEYEVTAGELGVPRDIYWAMALRATQANLRGRLDIAEQLARGAQLRGQELEQSSAGAYLLQRFVVRYQQARLAEELPGLRLVGEARSVFRAGGALTALAFAETGNAARSVEIAREILGTDGGAMHRDVFWLGGLAMFASTAATTGDRDLAHLCAELLLPCADHLVVFGRGGAVLGTGHHWLGVLAAALGDTDRGLEHLEWATLEARRIDAPYWIAEGLVETAHALAMRDRPNDGSAIRRHVNEATMIGRHGGYARVLNRAAALT
jgi:DNA-binding SARP family transcriptional activator